MSQLPFFRPIARQRKFRLKSASSYTQTSLDGKMPDEIPFAIDPSRCTYLHFLEDPALVIGTVYLET